MVDRSRNRSESYQWVIVESSCSPEILAELPEQDGLGAHLNPYGTSANSEEIKDLEEQLKAAFWKLVDTHLTKRQKDVLHLMAKGLTQSECALQLNVNQSSIHKSIFGNSDYSNTDSCGKKIKRSYGGSRKRLLKLMQEDETIKEIFFKISQCQDN